MNQIMKKTHYKRILGLFLVLLSAFIFPKTVFAAGSASASPMEACPALSTDTTNWAARYNMDIDPNSNNTTYTVSINVNNVAELKKIKGDIKFKVASISSYSLENGNDISTVTDPSAISKLITSSNKIVTPNKPIQVKRVDASKGGLTVVLESDGFDDPKFKKLCDMSKNPTTLVRIQASLEINGSEGRGDASECERHQYDGPIMNPLIDCSNYASKFGKESFEYNFCFAYDKAGKKTNPSSESAFKCDAKTIHKVEELKDDNYYVNKNYLRYDETKEVASGTYVYNYAKNPEKKTVSCSIKCIETVVVEYGPPVASKAGLCFEYKVKVTSRVNCGLVAPVPVPVAPPAHCEPYPVCKNSDGSGEVHRQGGPDEEFDACVNTCDGGKYTDRCSNKCYNTIYGNKSTGQELSYADNSANAVDVATTYKYEIRRNGEIGWSYHGTSRSAVDRDPRDPRWHLQHNWGLGSRSDYHCFASNSGIPRRCNCGETCKFYGCNGGSGVYLNPWECKDDEQHNYDEYRKLQRECTAKEKCETTTATFKINVDYTYGKKNTPATIYFPFTSNNDKNSEDRLTFNGAKTNTNPNTTILSADGCYKSDTDTNWYQAEWSFPGTWIHNKTGEISYKPETEETWTNYNKKFCTPLDANDVNQKWFNYYYAQLYGNDTSYSYNNSSHMTNICPQGSTLASMNCSYNTTQFTDSDVSKLTWNIHAATNNFGYFNWKIKMDCFYALNSEFPQVPGESCDPVCKPSDKDEGQGSMRVRAVDLNNLFPDSNGTPLNIAESTGRSPGYNWSKFAEQTKKDPEFISKPSNYATWVQKNNYSVYDDKYVDYEVNLTRDILKDLRNLDRNVTTYEGKVGADGSVTNYLSPLFRNGGKLSSTAIFPDIKTLKCNNIAAASGKRAQNSSGYSAECENFE